MEGVDSLFGDPPGPADHHEPPGIQAPPPTQAPTFQPPPGVSLAQFKATQGNTRGGVECVARVCGGQGCISPTTSDGCTARWEEPDDTSSSWSRPVDRWVPCESGWGLRPAREGEEGKVMGNGRELGISGVVEGSFSEGDLIRFDGQPYVQGWGWHGEGEWEEANGTDGRGWSNGTREDGWDMWVGTVDHTRGSNLPGGAVFPWERLGPIRDERPITSPTPGVWKVQREWRWDGWEKALYGSSVAEKCVLEVVYDVSVWVVEYRLRIPRCGCTVESLLESHGVVGFP